MAATEKGDDALSLIAEIDESMMPEHIKTDLLAIRVRVYLNRDKNQLAVDTIAQRVVAEPVDLHLRALQIRTYRMIGDSNSASEAFERALALVNDQTNLLSRLELSFEARQLKRDDVIIYLLKGRVATDRESEGLYLLISASINSSSWVTARETLDSVSLSLQGKEWFQRAEAILALNTGDVSADLKITQYLRQNPNDLEMILAHIGIWQRAGRDIDIRRFLQGLNLNEVRGRPEQRIRLATIICHYEEVLRGLEYG